VLENIFLPSSHLLLKEIQNSLVYFQQTFGDLLFIYLPVELRVIWECFEYSHFILVF